MEYSGHEDRHVVLPNHGPDDGTTGYLCRFQLPDILVYPPAQNSVQPVLIDFFLLNDRENRCFTGAASAYTTSDMLAGRLDPERFRFTANSDLFISDEYGLQLIEFASSGRELRRFVLPDDLRVTHPANSKIERTV